jgi:hypothetical protein
MRHLSVIVSAGLLAMPMAFTATAQPFQPISQLTTWYTDRNPVDIEIVAYQGVDNEARRLEPERVLQLRLERAYLNLLIRKERPISSAALLSFDLPTGLPTALFKAPPEQVEKRGDPIHQLLSAESTARTIIVLIEGDYTVEAFQQSSRELRLCKGDELQTDLFRYDGKRDPSCRVRSIGGGAKYVGKLTDTDLVFIKCSSAPIGCRMRTPFDGFFPSVSFNETHLTNWKNIATKTVAFLQSKRFH